MSTAPKQIPPEALCAKLGPHAGKYAHCSPESRLKKTAKGQSILNIIYAANSDVILDLSATEIQDPLSALLQQYKVSTPEQALQKAAIAGHKARVETLLQYDIDLEHKDTFTAKEWAQKRGRTAIVKLLAQAEQNRKEYIEEELILTPSVTHMPSPQASPQAVPPLAQINSNVFAFLANLGATLMNRIAISRFNSAEMHNNNSIPAMMNNIQINLTLSQLTKYLPDINAYRFDALEIDLSLAEGEIVNTLMQPLSPQNQAFLDDQILKNQDNQSPEQRTKKHPAYLEVAVRMYLLLKSVTPDNVAAFMPKCKTVEQMMRKEVYQKYPDFAAPPLQQQQAFQPR